MEQPSLLHLLRSGSDMSADLRSWLTIYIIARSLLIKPERQQGAVFYRARIGG